MFTKRHYEWLASWAGRNLTKDQWEALAQSLFNTQNNFNRARFLNACKQVAAEHSP